MKTLGLGFMAPRPGANALQVVLEAERLGYARIWGAENYGYDCFTGLAWWAGKTSKIGLGTTVAIVDARQPTTTAMTAASLDELSGGRFVLGMGVSSPTVVEGWYGRPFGRPLARTREYVAVIRQVLRREAPLTFEGEYYRFPAAGSSQHKPLKLIPKPRPGGVPIYLAAEGPNNVSMAGEIADGWCGYFLSNSADAEQWSWLKRGFAKRESGPPESFNVVSQVALSVHDDIERAADAVRPGIAFMVAAMGSEKENFHRAALERTGFSVECAEVARCWREGDRDGAARAVSTQMVAATALIGPWVAIRDQIARWRDTPVTSLLVTPVPGTELSESLLASLAEAAWK
jgi:F420-dependent oxidoreductase-like protein